MHIGHRVNFTFLESLCSDKQVISSLDLIGTILFFGADPGFFSTGSTKNAENQGHSSIELEMYKQYIVVLRAKRAYNLEARNVKKTV